MICLTLHTQKTDHNTHEERALHVHKKEQALDRLSQSHGTDGMSCRL